jgi:hypothetical protein
MDYGLILSICLGMWLYEITSVIFAMLVKDWAYSRINKKP